MRRIKRIIMLLSIFIIVYFTILFLYHRIVLSKEYVCVYALTKDITKGKNILQEDVYEIKLNKKEFDENFDIGKNIFDEEVVVSQNISRNQILTKDKIITKEEYVFDDSKEMIAINIENNSKYINSKLTKGSIVNIYFVPNENTVPQSSVEKVDNNVKILDISDKNGNSITNSKDILEIIVLLDKEKVLKINTLKPNGKFYVSIIN
ncbi:MAG: hypothetical protein IJ094_10700 [Bacilli bacterium]|nr:hypothetical protein [Bacilli bacterium]